MIEWTMWSVDYVVSSLITGGCNFRCRDDRSTLTECVMFYGHATTPASRDSASIVQTVCWDHRLHTEIWWPQGSFITSIYIIIRLQSFDKFCLGARKGVWFVKKMVYLRSQSWPTGIRWLTQPNLENDVYVTVTPKNDQKIKSNSCSFCSIS